MLQKKNSTVATGQILFISYLKLMFFTKLTLRLHLSQATKSSKYYNDTRITAITKMEKFRINYLWSFFV